MGNSLENCITKFDALIAQDEFEGALKFAATLSPEIKSQPEFAKRLQIIKNKTEHLNNREAYAEYYDKLGKNIGFVNVGSPTVEKRYEWLLRYLQSHPEIKKICDVGAHKGEFVCSLGLRGYELSGLEISEHNVQIAQKLILEQNLAASCSCICGFAEEANKHFSENSFDAVLLFELLEHVKNPQEVIESAEKLLKPEGTILVTLPYGPWEALGKGTMLTSNTPQEHIRSFDKAAITTLLGSRKNLTIEKIEYNEQLGWHCLSYSV